MVLAGGTMDPLPTLAADFFPSIPISPPPPAHSQPIDESDGSGSSVLRHFSCGHVIAPEQLTTLALCNGPGGVELDFRKAHGRDSDRTMDELGRLLRNSERRPHHATLHRSTPQY